MGKSMNHWRRLVLLPVLAGALALGACRDSGEGDYLAVAGKLFVFNYRIAQATYHLTLTKVRKVPGDAMLETTFENPAGGEPFIVRQNVWPCSRKDFGRQSAGQVREGRSRLQGNDPSQGCGGQAAADNRPDDDIGHG